MTSPQNSNPYNSLTKCRTYRLLQNKRLAEEISKTDFGKKLPFFAHRIFYLDFSR